MAPATPLQAIRELLRAHMPQLREEYGVVSLGLFGSLVRGDQQQASDVDILVEFASEARIGLFEYVRLQEHLADIIGRPADLVTRGTLKPRIGKRILDEAVPV